ncbi:hypothetical protein ZYGR_0AI02630 [Zygosaccharomyces rouxii]|uniref:SURF1-like protein n=1 Tax=Zygosaccharomyces rouxii TaxID=4956 RepID=A0A1Q3ABH0_ZYGRO|nr:hypothetical protein ZYGR_0AI02630 [Zygosaccharomyces rouxii]
MFARQLNPLGSSQRLAFIRLCAKRSVKTSTLDWKPIRTSKTPSDHERKKGGFGKKIVLGLMIAMPVISFYLGTWQVRRLEWKNNLIARCESRLTYPPVPLPKGFTPDQAENWEYRKVLLKGHFINEEEMFVGPRVRNSKKGYILFTPFVRKDTGEKVLVERGWVSEENVNPQLRNLHHLSVPTSENTELVCLVRVPRKRGSFQWKKEDQNSRLWQVPDVLEMASVTGSTPLHLQAIYDLKDHRWDEPQAQNNDTNGKSSSWAFWKRDKSLVQSALSPEKHQLEPLGEFTEWQFVQAGVPIGKEPKIDLRNNHLQYLITWYGLASLSTIFLIVALKKYRRGSAISQTQLKKEKLKHAQRFM